MATATVAAFASAGGLGRLLTSGQQQNDYPQMFAGALLVAVLAIVLDLLLGPDRLAGRPPDASAQQDRPLGRFGTHIT